MYASAHPLARPKIRLFYSPISTKNADFIVSAIDHTTPMSSDAPGIHALPVLKS